MEFLLSYPTATLAGLFLSLLACTEAGRRLAVRKDSAVPRNSGLSEGAVFALFGLLLAFSFSGAADRLQHRRDLIIDEANAIGTAYLRVDVSAPRLQAPLRDAFHRYVQSRMDAYAVVADAEAFRAALGRSASIQAEIWSLAVAGGTDGETAPGGNILLLPAVNEMIDISATRAAALVTHPPDLILGLLIGLSLLCAFLIGYRDPDQQPRRWVGFGSFAIIVSLVIYVIIDLEFPRLGIIQVGGFDQLIEKSVPVDND